jgi:hypothetical protein
MCQRILKSNTVCNTTINTTTMKNKLFILGLFLMAFTFLFAANSSQISKKKVRTSTPATTFEIHPLIVPLESF